MSYIDLECRYFETLDLALASSSASKSASKSKFFRNEYGWFCDIETHPNIPVVEYHAVKKYNMYRVHSNRLSPLNVKIPSNEFLDSESTTAENASYIIEIPEPVYDPNVIRYVPPKTYRRNLPTNVFAYKLHLFGCIMVAGTYLLLLSISAK